MSRRRSGRSKPVKRDRRIRSYHVARGGVRL